MMMWPLAPIPPPPIARRPIPRAASASASVARPPGSFFSSTTNWLAIGTLRVTGCRVILAPRRPPAGRGTFPPHADATDRAAGRGSERPRGARRARARRRGSARDPVSDAGAGRRDTVLVEASGFRWARRSGGDRGRPPLLLVHGVTASSRVWWRLGPA